MSDLGSVIQLVVLLVVGVTVLIAAYQAPFRNTAAFLILFIPFQLVETRYGSLNVGLTYLIGLGLVLRGRLSDFPLFPWVFLIVIAYLLALTQVDKTTNVQHMMYVISLVSGLLLFYICYNFALHLDNYRYVLWLLATLNVLVIVYCLIQLSGGPGSKITLFGISELSMLRARADFRLTGPFSAGGLTAEYFVTSSVLIGLLLLQRESGNAKLGLSLILFANAGMLVATGNRGGFLVSLVTVPWFVWLFRRRLGTRWVIGVLAGAAILFVGAAFIIINFTEFNVLFDRLENTEVEEGVPDTRSIVWPLAIEQISKNPILGNGPRFRLVDEDVRAYPGHAVLPFPHNLILFLLVTVGIVGATTVFLFFAALLLRLRRGRGRGSADPYQEALVRVGPLLVIVMLVDQMKVESFRFAVMDYLHYMLCIFGILLAAVDRGRHEGIESGVPLVRSAK